MSDQQSILARLMATIEDRKASPSAQSYTTSLMAGGVERIGAKLTEEAAEVVDAARSAKDEQGRSHLTHEAADLIYHLLVMLGYCEVSLRDVETELARRFGVSGLDERAARTRSDGQ